MFQVLAFLLTVEGLFFFRFVLPLVSKGSFFDSSEKVNPDPRVSKKRRASLGSPVPGKIPCT